MKDIKKSDFIYELIPAIFKWLIDFSALSTHIR